MKVNKRQYHLNQRTHSTIRNIPFKTSNTNIAPHAHLLVFFCFFYA